MSDKSLEWLGHIDLDDLTADEMVLLRHVQAEQDKFRLSVTTRLEREMAEYSAKMRPATGEEHTKLVQFLVASVPDYEIPRRDNLYVALEDLQVKTMHGAGSRSIIFFGGTKYLGGDPGHGYVYREINGVWSSGR